MNIREAKRQIKAADERLTANPDDIDAKKARIAAVMAVKAATESGRERRRQEFLEQLESPTVGPPGDLRGDPRDVWDSLSLAESLRLAPVVMDAWYFLAKATRMRDRMRCPRCTAVGTWKMYGTWWHRWRYGDVALRRWGCKFCGHWLAKGNPHGQAFNGRIQAFPLSQEGLKVWAYPDPSVEREPTPAETLHAIMDRTWPWGG